MIFDISPPKYRWWAYVKELIPRILLHIGIDLNLGGWDRP
jgi:hypothetical protein